jgi:hypothetical protein
MVATIRIGSCRTPVKSYMKKDSPDFTREYHPARTVTRELSRETMMGAWMTGLTPPAAAGRC